MYKLKNLFIVLGCLAAVSATSQTEYVNPLIGTNGMGHTFPGACAPFGVVQLSPDTESGKDHT